MIKNFIIFVLLVAVIYFYWQYYGGKTGGKPPIVPDNSNQVQGTPASPTLSPPALHPHISPVATAQQSLSVQGNFTGN
jgi:hypothetical protein